MAQFVQKQLAHFPNTKGNLTSIPEEVLFEWQSHNPPNVFRPLKVRVWQ